jgi:hypothetical protein
MPTFAAWPAALRRPAEHTSRGAQANAELTFTADHLMGADQNYPTLVRKVSVWDGSSREVLKGQHADAQY